MGSLDGLAKIVAMRSPNLDSLGFEQRGKPSKFFVGPLNDCITLAARGKWNSCGKERVPQFRAVARLHWLEAGGIRTADYHFFQLIPLGP